MIAVDGATWRVIDPMIERGELPNLARLKARGAHGRLWSFMPLASPVVWTTVATGRFARSHNVLDFLVPYRDQAEKRLVSSRYRRAPAIWNLASHFGRTVASVGWFVTHPPEVVRGTMITDQAASGRPGTCYPEDRWKEFHPLATALQTPESRDELLLDLLPALGEIDLAAASAASHPDHKIANVIERRIDRQIVIDEFVKRVTKTIAAEHTDLLLTYFRIVDHASHAAWIYHDARDFETKPESRIVRILGDLVQASYRYVDRAVGEILERCGEDVNVVILSDHGFGSATGTWAPTVAGGEWLTGNHRLDGIFLAAGPDVEPGEFDTLSTIDVFPHLMAWLGVPIAKDLPGTIQPSLFRQGFLRDHPLTEIDAYDIQSSNIVAGTFDAPGSQAEELDTLAALGYVSSSQRASVTEFEVSDESFWEYGDLAVVPALIGEITVRLFRGELEKVEALRAEIERNAKKTTRDKVRFGVEFWSARLMEALEER